MHCELGIDSRQTLQPKQMRDIINFKTHFGINNLALNLTCVRNSNIFS